MMRTRKSLARQGISTYLLFQHLARLSAEARQQREQLQVMLVSSEKNAARAENVRAEFRAALEEGERERAGRQQRHGPGGSHE